MDSQELKKLRDWFSKNAAALPWRPLDLNAPRNPYAVWISETMLQQTQVSTVKDYFIRWMNRFPDIATLAKATEEEVFKYWQGLGYYSRARNILKTAQIAVNGLPATRKELEALPGIGAYTAGAILSLAYHKPEAILDGNLVRIFSRFHALDFLPTENAKASETYWNFAKEVADSPKAYMHNEALMELGRTVCKIKNPECENVLSAGIARHLPQVPQRNSRRQRSAFKRIGTEPYSSSKARTTRFLPFMVARNFSTTSSPSPILKRSKAPLQACPRLQKI